MAKRKKKKNNGSTKYILIVLGLLVLAVIFLFSEINIISKTAQKKQGAKQEENQQQTDEKPKERLKFDSFIENADYDKEEIEKLDQKSLIDIYKNSKIIEKELKCDKVCGSSDSKKNAAKHVCKQLENEEKIVNSYKTEEDEFYYIIDANYSLKRDISKDNNTRMLVFNEKYYNSVINTFSVEDESIVKLIFDIDYYIKNYSNVGKKLIKSFIEEGDNQLVYTIYFIDYTYGQDNKKDYIQLVKETKKIDKSTGKLESADKEKISGKIII